MEGHFMHAITLIVQCIDIGEIANHYILNFIFITNIETRCLRT